MSAKCVGRDLPRPPIQLTPYEAAYQSLVHTGRMQTCCFPTRALTLKALCGWMWMLYISMCLAGWTLSSEAARPRCGSDLLSDLQFVCGERGIYLGKGSWSGYGPRPRGKGIVDKCCRSGGCDLQHLEMYCAEPKSPEAMAISSTTSRPHTPTPSDMFQAVFQKRLLEHLGPPDSPKREGYRKKKSAQPKRKNKSSSTFKRTRRKPTSQPGSALQSPF